MRTYISILMTICLLSCHDNHDNTQNHIKQSTTKLNRTFPKLNPNNYNVAFLIMNGVYNTELTAPFDIFQHTKFRTNIKAMNVFTIANTLEPIKSFEGLRLLPDYDYTKDNLPKIDILVVPSAEHHLDSDLKDTIMINFIKYLNFYI